MLSQCFGCNKVSRPNNNYSKTEHNSFKNKIIIANKYCYHV